MCVGFPLPSSFSSAAPVIVWRRPVYLLLDRHTFVGYSAIYDSWTVNVYSIILTSSNVLIFQSVVQESEYFWSKEIKSYPQLDSHCNSKQQKSSDVLFSTLAWSRILSWLQWMLDSSLISPKPNTVWSTRYKVCFCPIRCHLLFHPVV